jgi:putative FmdB family regulatory protein
VPTYQYACTACGHQLEAVQSFTDDPLTVCPACDGRLRKQFGSVGIVFKGPGFYRTDSRNGSSGNGNGKVESKSEAKTDGKSDGKSDGKPAPDKSTKSDKPKSSDKASATSTAATT